MDRPAPPESRAFAMNCRVLPHEPRDGPGNMALDEALLDAVDADPGAAVLRTYTWTAPTLSLGYFQAIEEVAPGTRWEGLPVVRRPSGGGALWHDREVTYALIVPRAHPLAHRPAHLYRAVHAAIAASLRAQGLGADRRGDRREQARGPRPFLCFLDDDPEDILIAGHKVVGSAQRRRPSAVLQHGSLLVGRSERTPELLGLEGLSGPSVARAGWPETIREAIPSALGLRPVESSLRPEERAAATVLERNVYRRDEWTRGRRRPPPSNTSETIPAE